MEKLKFKPKQRKELYWIALATGIGMSEFADEAIAKEIDLLVNMCDQTPVDMSNPPPNMSSEEWANLLITLDQYVGETK